MYEQKSSAFSGFIGYFLTCILIFAVWFASAVLFFPELIKGNGFGKILSISGNTGAIYMSESGKLDDELSINRLKEAYDMISTKYYGFSTVSKDALVTGMIRGMVDALGDPHSVFLDANETKQFNEELSGNFEGIGAYVGKIETGIVINRILDGSPAKEAWILAGDIIEKADGVLLKNLTVEEAVKKIRGPEGSQVVLSIVRPSAGNALMEKKLTRKHVLVPSVVSKMIDKTKIGLIDVTIFWETTPQEFNQAYDALTASGMQALILDLRDNPGGLLGTSVTLLSDFIDADKLIVETRWTEEDHNKRYYAEGWKRPSIPLIVLVNENSASASEITAGALQDYGIATIVGNTTYGKWSVQEAFPLRSTSELKITVARWYTPNGKWIDKLGIKPDILIKPLATDYTTKYDRVLELGQKIAEYELTGKTRADAIVKFQNPITN